MDRQKYVKRLKERLDKFDAAAEQWQHHAEEIKAKHLEVFNLRRDEAMYNLKLLENASAAAWKDFAIGCDVAWARLQDAYADARRHFQKVSRA